MPARSHSLDALRASALLLGVILHAALAYMPDKGIGWVQDRNTHVGFSAFVLLAHSFRLAVFFLLAGFFGRLLFLRRGPAGFVRNRLTRILVPLIVGWLLVYPLLSFGWIWAAMKAEPAAILPALVFGYGNTLHRLAGLMGIGTPEPGFPLTHLWFLYYLLLIYGAFLGLRWLASRMGAGYARGQDRADAVARWLFGSWWGLPVLVLITWGILLRMQQVGIDTPDKTFRPHGPVLALYLLVFGLGWLLHRQPELLDGLRRRWAVYAALAVAAALLTLGVAGAMMQPPHPLLWSVFQAAYACMMWAWIFALLGLFLRFCVRESTAWRYLADASYWVYMVHLPIVVAAQVALSRTSLSAGLKFGLVGALATAASLLTYHLCVRSTPIGQLLNGRRVPFRFWPGRRLGTAVQ